MVVYLERKKGKIERKKNEKKKKKAKQTYILLHYIDKLPKALEIIFIK